MSAASILQRLDPGTPVCIWFEVSGFLTTYVQSYSNSQAVFSGGALDSGLTYVNAEDIEAIKIGPCQGPPCTCNKGPLPEE